MLCPPKTAGIYTIKIDKQVIIKEINVFIPLVLPNKTIKPKKTKANTITADVLEYSTKYHFDSFSYVISLNNKTLSPGFTSSTVPFIYVEIFCIAITSSPFLSPERILASKVISVLY